MKILLINKFLYPKGGDAIVTLSTGRLLSGKGHKVIFWGMKHSSNPIYPFEDYFVSNVDFNKPMGVFQQLRAFFNILYSLEAKRKIKKLIEKDRPDIVHLNNFAHHISPSILGVLRKYNIPVVMTLHDFKLVCPYWYLFLDGKPCEMCKSGSYYYCFINRCNNNSFFRSLINTVEMYLHHKILHIYDLIDVFISPSMFLKEKMKKMGFEKEIIFLSNFIDMKDYSPKFGSDTKTICYFGRLSKEKGLFTLLDVIKKIDVKLKIIGQGRAEGLLKSKVKKEKMPNVKFLGYKFGEELKNEIKSSMAVVLPSECSENSPRSILEAFALGKPVIGSRIGGIPELVKDGKTGLTFEPGNSKELRNRIEFLMKEPDKVVEMGKNARKFVKERFSAEKHYQKLMEIYTMAKGKRK